MPRATSKGESSTSREMVDRWSLSNGTAVQIHWPSSIEQDEGELLQEWLQLITKKILARVQQPAAGIYDPIPQQEDWRAQRDRTKQALADRIVEVPTKGPSLWDRPSYADAGVATGCTCRPGCASRESSERCDCTCVYCHAQNVPPPPPSDLRKYYNGCQCADCCENYRAPGTQYIDASMPGFQEHVDAQAIILNPPIVTFDQVKYFQGCKCEQCKANRHVGALVWLGSVDHRKHMETVNAVEIKSLEEGPF